MSEVICWPCRHGDHEDCEGEQHACFCAECWDDEERACHGDPHEQAIEIAALVAV